MRNSKKSVLTVTTVLSSAAIIIGLGMMNADRSTPASTLGNGIVYGQVLLGPTCPVERIPPDPACAPKPYKTTINILRTPSGATYRKVATNASGRFTLSLAPGRYVLRATSHSIYPRCSDKPIKVLARKSQSVKIECDTGIR